MLNPFWRWREQTPTNLNTVDVVSERVGNYQFHPQWGMLLDQLWVQ